MLEFSLLYGEDYSPLSWALELPSLAAVNLESKGVIEREALRDALKEAERYAMSDYLVEIASGVEAAWQGCQQDGGGPDRPAARSRGAPARAHLPSLFIKEFDRANGQVLSRYDGSVSGPDPNPASRWPNGPDPVLDATLPLWTAAFVDYSRQRAWV